MPCTRALKGYRNRVVNPATGKRSIVFSAREGLIDFTVDLPCGQCMDCRLERSRQWAIRCVHEASLWERNCFITLTYNDQHLPPDGSLQMKDFQDFMKRLRKRFGAGIRYFHCGEYGEKFQRPHYHACLFNFDFNDKVVAPIRQSEEYTVYTSAELSKLWKFGFSTVGACNFETAAYVARYVTKKITGNKAFVDSRGVQRPSAADHYAGRRPEYITMSRRPGIAAGWFEKYSSDVYPSDRIVIRGKEMRPPKFYDALFERSYPSDFARIKRCRKRIGRDLSDREYFDRKDSFVKTGRFPRCSLLVREEIQMYRFKQLKRRYEGDS